MNKIFYSDDEEEFYNIKFSDKTITIDWIKSLPAYCKEGEELDQNVFWISKLPFIVKKNKPDKYCMQYFNKTEILLYPFRSGTPFYLRQATEEDVRNQINDCEKCGVSSEYYEKILQAILK